MSQNVSELKEIITKFANCGWDLIDAPAKAWLSGDGDNNTLVSAIQQADKECGSCGCEFDVLYKRSLELINLV